MLKNIILTATVFCTLGAVNPVKAQKAKQGSTSVTKNDVKFLDDISIEPTAVPTSTSDTKTSNSDVQLASKKTTVITNASADIEAANRLQFKYALLLNLE